jgi:meiotic recombination protein SPO11
MHVLTRDRFGIDKDALIPISRADERKVRSGSVLYGFKMTPRLSQARSMLRRELPDRWKRELVHMLFTRRKAETEVLCSMPRNPDEPHHPLVRYLADRIWECILVLVPEPAPGLSTNDGVDKTFLA